MALSPKQLLSSSCSFISLPAPPPQLLTHNYNKAVFKTQKELQKPSDDKNKTGVLPVRGWGRAWRQVLCLSLLTGGGLSVNSTDLERCQESKPSLTAV